MFDHTRLDWRVPSNEWNRFRTFVEDRFDSLGGYLGREAEAAMREYIDEDGYGDIEARVNYLMEAAGRRSEPASKKIISEFGDDRSRVTVKVETEVKDEFRAFVSESEHSFGVEFAKAIRSYREGGRRARLEQKLDRILDDAADLLSEINDSDSEQKLTLTERKTIAISNELEEQFVDAELVETIKDVAGVSSEPSIEKYRTRVVERLDMEPHPDNPDLWIPSEMAADLIPEGTPRVSRLPVELLDREERIERMKIEVGVRAANRSSGMFKAETDDIRADVFDNEISKSSVLDLMRAASDSAGYDVSKRGGVSALHVNLDRVSEADEYLMLDIIEYRDGVGESLLSAESSATVSDFETGTPEQAPSVVEADAQLKTLAQAATDGGKPE